MMQTGAGQISLDLSTLGKPDFKEFVRILTRFYSDLATSPLRTHDGIYQGPITWVFGEGVDSARGVVAIVVFCRNSSCNSSCDTIVRNGGENVAFLLLLRVQQFVCNSQCEGTFQTCSKCGLPRQVLQSHPLPISPLLKTPELLKPVECQGLTRGTATFLSDCPLLVELPLSWGSLAPLHFKPRHLKIAFSRTWWCLGVAIPCLDAVCRVELAEN